MKILEIVPSLSPGGGERLVVDLSNELSKTHNVVLMTLWDERLSKNSFYKQDVDEHVHYVNACLVEKNKISVLWGVVKEILRVNPDIVHLHMCHMFAALAVVLLGKRYKFYLTIHNNVKNIYDTSKIKLLFNLLGRLNLLRFVTISQTNYDDFKEVYPMLENHLVYNGRKALVPTNKIKAVEEEINCLKNDKRSKVFLHIARCSQQKNQIVLVKAFNKLIRDGLNGILLIIGADFEESELGKILREEACDRIHFIGVRNNVADYIFSSDAFVLSSLWEGMPITLLECINSGLPVVSTPTCGAVDVITNGENGILSRDFSVDGFADAIKDFCIKETDIKAFCEKNKGNSKYDIQYCAEEYSKIFQKELERKL